METKIEKITPQKALELLKNNVKNRNLRQSLVLAYSEEMKKGRWRLTGQGISFSSEMILIDGQHRLAAIVKSNTSQIINVTYGLNYDDVYSIYDTGKNRTSSDILAINNVKNASSVSGSIRNKRFLDLNTDPGKGKDRIKLTNEDILNNYSEHPELYTNCVNMARRCYSKMKLVSVVYLAGIASHLILTKGNNQDKVFSFFNQLHLIDDSTINSIKLLRNLLINDLANPIKKMKINIKVLYFKKVWNAFVSDDDYKILRLVDKDSNNQFI